MVARRVLAAVLTISVAIAAAGVAATADGPGTDNPYATKQFVLGLVCVLVGGFIAWQRPRHPIGWLLIVAGDGAWLSFAVSVGIGWIFVHHPEQETLGRVILHLGVAGWILSRGVLTTLVPQAFPDGFSAQRGRRWLRWASIASIAVTVVAHSRLWTFEYFEGQPATGTGVLAERVLPWGHRAILVCAALSLIDLIVRTVRLDADVRRQQQWFVGALAIVIVPLQIGLVQAFHPIEIDLGDLELWSAIAVPIVLLASIVRYRLFDIRVLVRRATVFGAVTAILAVVYLVSVWVATTLTPEGSNAPPVIAAGVVAISLAHVRAGVQSLVSRRLFGGRDDPYTTLVAFGSKLEATAVDDEALQTVTDTIRDSLRLPWCAIDLAVDEQTVRAAESGTPADTFERLPLIHRGTEVGALLVGHRTPGERFTGAEHDLLRDLARQVSVLASNVALTDALRRSRTVLVKAREEERRRIRADLHDGLGPTLATVALGLGAATERLSDGQLRSLLTDLEREVQTAISDVRTLAYGLRPAALDDLGLVSALREYAGGLARRTADGSRPLSVDVDAPSQMAPMPAAVEVAAYRIALEALTNVARHAGATHCSVRLGVDDGLELTITDDGVGMGDGTPAGVGMSSMRERVAELGGRFQLLANHPTGTTVSAWFPIQAAVAP